MEGVPVGVGRVCRRLPSAVGGVGVAWWGSRLWATGGHRTLVCCPCSLRAFLMDSALDPGPQRSLHPSHTRFAHTLGDPGPRGVTRPAHW